MIHSRLCKGLLMAAALLVGPQSLAADPYPTKPVRFLVGFAPGGANDLVARVVAAKLGPRLGQQVVVDNRAGGAGIVAAVLVAKAPPDGYTLFAGSISTLATNVSMHSKLPYDPVRDFAPVTTTTSPYSIIMFCQVKMLFWKAD